MKKRLHLFPSLLLVQALISGTMASYAVSDNSFSETTVQAENAVQDTTVHSDTTEHSDSTYIADNDSVRTTVLDELIVKSEYQWFEGDKLIAVPTRQEKNVSNSPESLIEVMNIPMLRVKDGIVTDVRGYNVVYYINGVKAESTDIATFWPKDALRVEYIRNPTDPKYQGAAAVVNFVMREYVAGGITKFYMYQRYPWTGYYDVSSKLVYKKMTFGATVKAFFQDENSMGSSGSEEYRDLYYDGKYYDSITRLFSEEYKNKDHNINAAFNARYTGPKFEMIHAVSLNYKRNPPVASSSSEQWDPNLFDAVTSRSDRNSKSITPSVSGYYGGYVVPQKAYLMGGWQYTYTRNNDRSAFAIGDMAPIANNILEDVNRLTLTFQPWYVPSPKWTFALRMVGSGEWYKAVYAGSANETTHQKRLEFTGNLTVTWNAKENLRINLRPGVLLSRYSSGGFLTKTARPSAEMGIDWTPTRKLNLSTILNFYYGQPDASATADVLIRTSELFWTAGNPELKNTYSTSGSVYGTYMPFDFLSGTLIFSYNRINNNIFYTYEAAPAERGGLIRRPMNSPLEQDYNTGLDLSANFFRRTLSISVYPYFYHQRFSGEYAGKLNSLQYQAQVSYMIRNVRFNLLYNSKTKYLTEGGMSHGEQPDNLSFSVSYGNGNFWGEVTLSSIYRKDRWKSNITESHYYAKDTRTIWGHRLFNISLSYTFGYGKKVDPGINIQGLATGKSGIVGK